MRFIDNILLINLLTTRELKIKKGNLKRGRKKRKTPRSFSVCVRCYICSEEWSAPFETGRSQSI